MSDPVQLDLFAKPTTAFVEGQGVSVDAGEMARERAKLYDDPSKKAWVDPAVHRLTPAERNARLDPLPKANEVQVDGDHYRQLGVQPWDAIRDWGLGFLDGNVVKYIARYRRKHGLVDLHKARHYLQKLIEEEEGKL
jgi:hypothetical protein